MHAVLEDIVHVAVLEAVADAAGVALRGALAAIGDADLVEIAHQIAVQLASERGSESLRINRSAISHGLRVSR